MCERKRGYPPVGGGDAVLVPQIAPRANVKAGTADAVLG